MIAAHVTLCREDEIISIEKIINNLKAIQLEKPLLIQFGEAERFDADKGVLIPARKENKPFHELRKAVLKEIIESPREQLPHITLMHPRNSTCTDFIFKKIKHSQFPKELSFDKVSLIEQKNGGRWVILDEFSIIKSPTTN